MILSHCTISDVNLVNLLIIDCTHVIQIEAINISCRNTSSSNNIRIVEMSSLRTSDHILSKFTLVTEALPTHRLLNPYVNCGRTCRSIGQVVLEGIVTLLLEDRSLIDERSLDTLDTFPIEIRLQNDRSKLLLNENHNSVKTIIYLCDSLAHRLELFLQILDSVINLCIQLSNSCVDIDLRELLLQVSNLLGEILNITFIQDLTLKVLDTSLISLECLELIVECSNCSGSNSLCLSLCIICGNVLLESLLEVTGDSSQLTFEFCDLRSISLCTESLAHLCQVSLDRLKSSKLSL